MCRLNSLRDGVLFGVSRDNTNSSMRDHEELRLENCR